MIIIEGPDGSGKTTLINRLSKDLDIPIMPRVVGTDTKPLDVDIKQWVEDNTDGFKPVLYDRHRMISEGIYGPLFGRVSKEFEDEEWLQKMMDRFVKSDPILIFCSAPYVVAWDNIVDDEDNSIFKDNEAAFARIYFGYFELFHLFHDYEHFRRMTAFDYTADDSEEHYQDILEAIKLSLEVESSVE